MKTIVSITFIHNGCVEAVHVSDGYEISQQSERFGEESLHPCPCYFASHPKPTTPDYFISEMAILTIAHAEKP